MADESAPLTGNRLVRQGSNVSHGSLNVKESSSKLTPGGVMFSSMRNLMVSKEDVNATRKSTLEQTQLLEGMDEAIKKPELMTDPEVGLTKQEAAKRLEEYGRNELPSDPPTPIWKIFLAQFADLLVILLIIACIISFAFGQLAAAITILIILIMNASLGVVMEYRAGQSLQALQSLTGTTCQCRREGQIIDDFNAALLVPGDVVILSTGCKVPADIKLTSAKSLSINEISLTGESEPVKKDANAAEAPEMKEEVKEGEKEKPTALCFMGTEVAEGSGTGIVIVTGKKTKMGQVDSMIKNADSSESPLQTKLTNLGFKLGIASIAISVVVLIVGLATGRGGDASSSNPHALQMVLLAVSLTVAVVPEGLPACVTITLAVGMHHMARKHALIKNLHSVETLGSASVICTDKTGTLTAGVMTMVRMWMNGKVFKTTEVGYNPQGQVLPLDEQGDAVTADSVYALPLLNCLLGTNKNTLVQYDEKEGYTCSGNMTERPLVVAAAKVGIDKPEILTRYDAVHSNPFNSMRKRQSALLKVADPVNTPYGPNIPYIAVANGAPNVLLELCTHISVPTDNGLKVEELTQAKRDEIMTQVDDFSDQAYRVLGTAYKVIQEADKDAMINDVDALESGLTLCGLVASIDPERDGVSFAIEKARQAGVKVCMITGDYVKTAKAIAKNVGLLKPGAPDNKSIDCMVLRTMGTVENDLLEALRDNNDKAEKQTLTERLNKVQAEIDELTSFVEVYARAKPIDKITIVRSYQRQQHVVAMTGDGVNDGPAIKQANIGIAMGKTGTDVARGCADMILTDDNFVSIVDAIEEGRTIYANITKFVFYLLSTNVSEVMVVLVAVVGGYPTLLNAIQILWLNLVTDGAPAIALAVELTEPGVMQEGPRSRSEQLIERVMITGILIQTVLLSACVLMTYLYGLYGRFHTWDGIEISNMAVYVPPASMNITDVPELYASEKAAYELEYATNVKAARTMTIFVIVFAELLRAYTSRSIRHSILTCRMLCSNKWMQYSVSSAMILTIIVFHVPGIMDVFGAAYLKTDEYLFCFAMIWAPCLGDEMTKCVYRWFGFGERPKFVQPKADEERMVAAV